MSFFLDSLRAVAFLQAEACEEGAEAGREGGPPRCGCQRQPAAPGQARPGGARQRAAAGMAGGQAFLCLANKSRPFELQRLFRYRGDRASHMPVSKLCQLASINPSVQRISAEECRMKLGACLGVLSRRCHREEGRAESTSLCCSVGSLVVSRLCVLDMRALLPPAAALPGFELR